MIDSRFENKVFICRERPILDLDYQLEVIIFKRDMYFKNKHKLYSNDEIEKAILRVPQNMYIHYSNLNATIYMKKLRNKNKRFKNEK